MPASKAQQKAVNKYMKENYDRFLTTFKPKGRLDIIKAHAAAYGESANAFINRAIDQTMERDSGRIPSEITQQAAEWPSSAGVVSLPSETVEAAQRAAEAGKGPVPVDKAKAAEKLFDILGDLGTIDLDKARCERLGIVYLSPDTLAAAQQAAEAAGEALPNFVARAVETQVKRDQSSLRLGINPATGGKIERDA